MLLTADRDLPGFTCEQELHARLLVTELTGIGTIEGLRNDLSR